MKAIECARLSRDWRAREVEQPLCLQHSLIGSDNHVKQGNN